MQFLQRYRWPGNVRELANSIERAVILCRGPVLLPDAFDEQFADPAGVRMPKPAAAGVTSRESGEAELYDLDRIERQAIDRALIATSGNRTRAAKLLGISERTLRNKLNAPRAEITSDT
jgi:DNA-binding NtrC family response regulator